MRRFCMVLLFVPLLSVAAQPEGLAVVADPDGHANLRARPDLKSKVLAKLPNGTPIYCLSDEAGNGGAQFCDARLQTPSEGGFVHHSRLVFPKRSGGFVPPSIAAQRFGQHNVVRRRANHPRYRRPFQAEQSRFFRLRQAGVYRPTLSGPSFLWYGQHDSRRSLRACKHHVERPPRTRYPVAGAVSSRLCRQPASGQFLAYLGSLLPPGQRNRLSLCLIGGGRRTFRRHLRV